MKLIVLGANSLLGRALVQLLQQLELEFFAQDSGAVNLLKKQDVVRALSSFQADMVINVASYANLEKAEADPEAAAQCDQINAQGVSLLAEACQSLELPLIHHSSSFVFDGQKTHPYEEDDTTNPVSRYGMSKWYGERAIREVLPRHIILRTDWLFSHEQPAFFQRHIEDCKLMKGQLEVVNHRFSPTPANDAARVLLAIARQMDCDADVWGTYHYCALQPMSQDHFIESFLQEAGKYDAELAAVLDDLQMTRLPVELPYIENTVLSCQKIFETFGIKQRARTAEINAVLQALYHLQEMPKVPDRVTPDKGDIADREEDRQEPPKVRKRVKADKPAKKAGKRKASPQS